MKAALINTRDLTTYEECDRAIDSVKTDWRNVVGGIDAWNSGRETILTTTAQRKIDSLQRKIDKMDTDITFDDVDGDIKL